MTKNDPERKKSFLSIFEELSKNRSSQGERNGHAYHEEGESEHEPLEELEYEGGCVLTDEIDHLILMHRDAHFGGDFDVMLKYYEAEDSIGIHPDFDPERIEYLGQVEKELGDDLAPLILTGVEAEKVGRSRLAYAKLKEIYEMDSEPDSTPRLLADLILSEEEEPEQEMDAVVSQGTFILPDLFVILKADEFYDSLFPGYGYAPYLAIQCIGKIGDPSGIVPLFESLAKQTIFDEMVAVDAMVEIGGAAKNFLLKILKSRPVTQDNSNAAFALTAFAHDPQVALACLQQLSDPDVQDKPLVRMYLINNCDALKTTPYRAEFIQMAQDPLLPSQMRSEMQILIEEWNIEQ